MATKIQLRRDTLANWLKADPVLMDGEQVLVATNASQPTVYDSKKVGDGTHKFSELEMLGYKCLQTTGDSQLFPMSQKAVTDLFNSDTPQMAESLPFASMTSPTGLGNYRKDGSSGFTAVTATTIAGFQNMNSNIDGVIKSISFCSKGTSMKFGIGIIDQRNIAVIRKTFEVNCTADALNTINLAKQGLQIYKGETLFAIFSSNETSICYRNNSSATADVQMVSGFKGRELHTLKTTMEAD